MSRASDRARARSAAEVRAPITRKRQRNTRPTLWEHGEFVAVDGEGFSDGEAFKVHLGAKGATYRGNIHRYAYLAASDGSAIYSADRLGMIDCLAFLCAIVETNPRAILVAFGGSYDVTHMIGLDLSAAQIGRAIGKEDRRLVVSSPDFDYALDYRPRKCLTVQRWPAGARRWVELDGERRATPHLTVRLWDVWGFFQDSFVGVMKKWLPGDPDFAMISREKGNRSIFRREELATIKRYNRAELACLVKIMDKVRAAIGDLGLKITRWDGAGAVAAAMLKRHGVKAHRADLPADVFEAARRAYSGGHIEACQVGYHAGTVHHYDVNSAYPDQFRRLPSLSNGIWQSGIGPPPSGYTIVKVRYSFTIGLPFYPLFHRCKDGSILYPFSGEGWYWFDEFEVASQYHSQYGGAHFNVTAWYHLREVSEDRPFAWVEDYYSARQDHINSVRGSGRDSGAEKIIKLGLNSLYGKTAQQVGWRIKDGELRLPPYFQIDWAGYVTAGCRAKLMRAALSNPDAIIGFATDGLFSTAPLDLEISTNKALGGWDYQVHTGITIVMPGVYWLHDPPSPEGLRRGERETVRHYSRGFDKREMSDPEFIHEAWRRGEERVRIKIRRLIGLGSAAVSEGMYKMRGCFVESDRWLRLDGDNSKRFGINVKTSKPHLGLVATFARDRFEANWLDDEESAPYPIAWLDGTANRDMVESETADEVEAIDAELA